MRIHKEKKSMGSNVDMDPRGMPQGTKILAYLRHSPGDNQTHESQEAAIRNLVKEKNWIIDRIFRDAGISGKSVDIRKGWSI